MTGGKRAEGSPFFLASQSDGKAKDDPEAYRGKRCHLFLLEQHDGNFNFEIGMKTFDVGGVGHGRDSFFTP